MERARVISLYRDGKTEYIAFRGEATPAPEDFSLLRNWNESVPFINDVRNQLSMLISKSTLASPRRRPPLDSIQRYWDFSKIKKVTIQACLVLASEYDRARHFRGFLPKAVNIDQWDPSVASMLEAVGFLELTGIEKNRPDTPSAQTFSILRMRRGEDVNGEKVADYLKLLGIDLTVEDPSLNDAIMEAITNCVQHAYKIDDLCPPHTLKAWWIAATLHHDANLRKLRIGLYDQGASIPATLPAWSGYEALQNAVRAFLNVGEAAPEIGDTRYDGKRIELAIQIGRSSTGDAERGKGLRQIVDAVELCKAGSVTIYSRCGVYRHSKGQGTQVRNYDVALTGTLVVWDLTF